MAVVIGHEIAHAMAHHGNERMIQVLAVPLGGLALSAAIHQKPQQTRQLFMTAHGLGLQVGVMLPFSRKQELKELRFYCHIVCWLIGIFQ